MVIARLQTRTAGCVGVIIAANKNALIRRAYTAAPSSWPANTNPKSSKLVAQMRISRASTAANCHQGLRIVPATGIIHFGVAQGENVRGRGDALGMAGCGT
jgi:hypothetical protein